MPFRVRGMYGKTFSALAALMIMAIGSAFFVWQSAHREGKTYKNSVFGYTLTYPSNLNVKEYTDDDTVFGIVSRDSIDGRAEVRVITVQGEAGQTVHDAVADQLKSLCDANGPNSSFTCSDTISTEQFTTANAEQGYVVMLRGKRKDLRSGIDEDVPMGPYYMITLATTASISKVVVVAPPLNQDNEKADALLIRSMAQSVRVTK